MRSFCGGAKDWDECSCDCHQTGAMHIMACCSQCPYCHKNIRIFHFDDHKKDCGEKYDYIDADYDPFYLRKKGFISGSDDD